MEPWPVCAATACAAPAEPVPAGGGAHTAASGIAFSVPPTSTTRCCWTFAPAWELFVSTQNIGTCSPGGMVWKFTVWDMETPGQEKLNPPLTTGVAVPPNEIVTFSLAIAPAVPEPPGPGGGIVIVSSH